MSEKKATKKAEKKEFTMEQAFAMWKNTSKAGKNYFKGSFGGEKLVGYYNTNKKNPKEPDIRIYKLDQEGKQMEEVFVSLWCNVSKNGKKYLSGKIDEKRVVGFINAKATEKQPYFSCYYSETDSMKNETKKEPAAKEEFMNVPEEAAAELPF